MRNLILAILFAAACGGSSKTNSPSDPAPNDPSSPSDPSSPVRPPGSDPADDPTAPPTTNPPTDAATDPNSPSPSPGRGPLKDVSFSTQVVPIFAQRGCEPCHSGNGIGRDLGNLTLDGSVKLIYKEVTAEQSPEYKMLRVTPKDPAKSMLLTLPSGTAGTHPVVVFKDPATDRDYQTILVWITEGAKSN